MHDVNTARVFVWKNDSLMKAKLNSFLNIYIFSHTFLYLVFEVLQVDFIF